MRKTTPGAARAGKPSLPRAQAADLRALAGASGRGEKNALCLFAGASGTGKTLAAEALAAELGRPLHRIKLPAVAGRYIGETEKNLRRILDKAEAVQAILLFDEADALFGKRTDVKDSHDRYANVETNYLLQALEAYPGLVILTSNRKESLDEAHRRRLRHVIDFSTTDP